jgi:molybdopterin-synthase adenylyltransferase
MAVPSQPSLPSDSAAWVNRLRELAVDDGGAWVASLATVRTVAAEFGRTRREVELAAVEARILPWRHKRNLGTTGWEGLARLMRSTAAVVGLGGLGGYVVEGLARMGVGRLILMDGDVFAEHNLNRQLFSTEADIGRSKAEAARERVLAVNSAVDVTLYDTFATAETLPAWLQGADVVVDCTDRLPIRFTLQDAAARAGIPMVHGAIAGYIGQVMTIMPGDEGLRALYGSGPTPERGLEVELGNPAATPMMIAAWEVQETVKVLLGVGRPLCRRMLFMDAEAGSVDVIELGCE